MVRFKPPKVKILALVLTLFSVSSATVTGTNSLCRTYGDDKCGCHENAKCRFIEGDGCIVAEEACNGLKFERKECHRRGFYAVGGSVCEHDDSFNAVCEEKHVASFDYGENYLSQNIQNSEESGLKTNSVFDWPDVDTEKFDAGHQKLLRCLGATRWIPVNETGAYELSIGIDYLLSNATNQNRQSLNLRLNDVRVLHEADLSLSNFTKMNYSSILMNYRVTRDKWLILKGHEATKIFGQQLPLQICHSTCTEDSSGISTLKFIRVIKFGRRKKTKHNMKKRSPHYNHHIPSFDTISCESASSPSCSCSSSSSSSDSSSSSGASSSESSSEEIKTTKRPKTHRTHRTHRTRPTKSRRTGPTRHPSHHSKGTHKTHRTHRTHRTKTPKTKRPTKKTKPPTKKTKRPTKKTKRPTRKTKRPKTTKPHKTRSTKGTQKTKRTRRTTTKKTPEDPDSPSLEVTEKPTTIHPCGPGDSTTCPPLPDYSAEYTLPPSDLVPRAKGGEHYSGWAVKGPGREPGNTEMTILISI